MKGDLKTIKAKLSELMAMCGDDCDEDEMEESPRSNVEPQDGQPKASADINNGGQETLEDAVTPKSGFFMNSGPPEGEKKKKLDVIAASMKRRLGK